jgi:hypothetical protein
MPEHSQDYLLILSIPLSMPLLSTQLFLQVTYAAVMNLAPASSFFRCQHIFCCRGRALTKSVLASRFNTYMIKISSYCDTFLIKLLQPVLHPVSYHNDSPRYNTRRPTPRLHHERTQHKYGCSGLLYEHITDSQLDKNAGWDGTQLLVYSMIALLIAQKTMSLAGLSHAMV